MSDYQAVEIPFKMVGDKQFLGLHDVKRLGLEDFIKRFEHCLDSYEPACLGMQGYFYYPEGKPKVTE